MPMPMPMQVPTQVYEEPKAHWKLREDIRNNSRTLLRFIHVTRITDEELLERIAKMIHVDVYQHSDGYHCFDNGKHFHYFNNGKKEHLASYMSFEKKLFELLATSTTIETFIYNTLYQSYFNIAIVFQGIQPTLRYLDLPDYSRIHIQKLIEINPTCMYDSTQTSGDEEYVGDGDWYSYGDYRLNFRTHSWELEK